MNASVLCENLDLSKAKRLENQLMDAFPIKDFIEWGLTRYYPRMIRGLPRLYHRDNPSRSEIKPNFTHLPTLKRQAMTKALFSLYKKYEPKGKLTLLTPIKNEDFSNAWIAPEVYRLLQGRFPNLTINLVSIDFEKEVPEPVLVELRAADLIIEIPTFELLHLDLSGPKIEAIGEFGFIERDAPSKFENYSMGLHFLEKGVLTYKPREVTWQDVKNEKLNAWRQPEHRFYFVQCGTPIGVAIYLHALLKSLENETRGIDLYFPDLHALNEYMERQKQNGRPLLEWELGIESIEVQGEVIQVGTQGKKIRIYSLQELESSDLQILPSLSDPFFAISSTQSLCEAVSMGKPFFYDGVENGRTFIRDWVALAENQIGSHKAALACIQGISQSLLYQLPAQGSDWVDETFFQERIEWPSIALSMGLALQDPEVIAGFQKLSQIVRSEFSCNSFLCHLVQRAFYHRHFEIVEDLEKELVSQFGIGMLSFASVIKKMQIVT